jgi:hypothetical protein
MVADLGADDAVLRPALLTGAGFDRNDLGVQHRLPEGATMRRT